MSGKTLSANRSLCPQDADYVFLNKYIHTYMHTVIHTESRELCTESNVVQAF